MTFVSYDAGGLDALILRLLAPEEISGYVEVDPPSPVVGSVTFALYERGARGVIASPSPSLLDEFRRRRPLDTPLEPCPSPLDSLEHALARFGSQLGRTRVIAIHCGSLADAGSAIEVLTPELVAIVVVVSREITLPGPAGVVIDQAKKWLYFPVDGMRHVLVAPRLEPGELLRIAPGPYDDLLPVGELELQLELSRLRAQLVEYEAPLAPKDLMPFTPESRSRERTMIELRRELERLETRINEILASTSWQATRPLRQASSHFQDLRSFLRNRFDL